MVNPTRRWVSLDVARGITIAFMILVNNGGSGKYSYQQLEHSPWNGWTLTDLVFPSFLFIAGIAADLLETKASEAITAIVVGLVAANAFWDLVALARIGR